MMPTTHHSPPPVHLPTIVTELSPSRTVVTSFSPKCQSLEDGDWVLAVAAGTSSSDGLACALSNGQVQVYDPERLHAVQTYLPASNADGTPGGITNLKYALSPTSGDSSPTAPSLLWVTHSSGDVRIYDTRQVEAVGGTNVPRGANHRSGAAPAWDVAVGYHGTVAAVASKRKIHFWDARQQGWLGSYGDAHTDHVTRVCFCSNSSAALLSGGEDGLVCAWDTARPSETEALQSVWNVGSPVRQLGDCAFEQAAGTVWCLTGSETVGLWNPSTNEAHDFGLETRQSLSSSCSIAIDYLVDCYWDTTGRDLWLTAGNSQGDAAVFRGVAAPNSSAPPQLSSVRWEACHVLTGGHRGVVRGTCHPAPHLWFTAGEDARLCEWNRWGSHHRGEGGSNGGSAASRVPISRPPPSCAAGGGPVRRSRARPNTGPY